MYSLLLVIGLGLFHTVTASWDGLLEKYASCMNESTYALLHRQCHDFAAGAAPKIADACIKQIPIVENFEPIVHVDEQNHPRIKVMQESEFMLAHQRAEDIDPRSDKHGFVRQRVYDALVAMIDELDKIAPHFGYEAGELEIRLFEGLRDLGTQKELFDSKLAIIKEKNPHMTDEQAYQEACKYISPYINNVPVHSTGAAVDIHLWSNKKQSFCNFGAFNVGGAFSPTFTLVDGLTEEQMLHRLLIAIAATQAGLTNYVYEFWHFSLGDRYACYWREDQADARVACYNSL
ncbi:hypothetical protein KBD08_02265 [Candidatus Babeliales bacterium]|nr:hypothetical protein [Candidatus Babeliales bacterium]